MRSGPVQRVLRHLGALFAAMAVFGAAVVACPTPAEAAAKVFFTDVRIPDHFKDPNVRKRKMRLVRKLLAESAKRAQFGKAEEVKISAEVKQLDLEEVDGVLKVRCTMIGRIRGGPLARSHLEFGGRPSERRMLERRVLGMVADGLVTRLAQMARERAAKEHAGAPKPGAKPS
jgi:hypothetical protein